MRGQGWLLLEAQREGPSRPPVTSHSRGRSLVCDCLSPISASVF